MNRLPSLKYLRDTYNYDPDTGEFSRKSTGHIFRPTKGKKYLCVVIRSVSFKVHRIVYYMHTGRDPGELFVDHVNRDTFDNRFTNLRLVNRSLQNLNRSNSVLLSMDGITMCLADWAKKTGISARTIRHRLSIGWSVTEALSVVPHSTKRKLRAA